VTGAARPEPEPTRVRATLVVIARAVDRLQARPARGHYRDHVDIPRNPPTRAAGDQVAQLLEQRDARMEANDRNADEAILLDRDGHVAEATADNVSSSPTARS